MKMRIWWHCKVERENAEEHSFPRKRCAVVIIAWMAVATANLDHLWHDDLFKDFSSCSNGVTFIREREREKHAIDIFDATVVLVNVCVCFVFRRPLYNQNMNTIQN